MNLTEYFDAVYRNYEGTEKQTGYPVDFFYKVAGHTLCLSIAHRGLVPHFTAALAHLAVKPSAPADLTVYIWDSAGRSSIKPPNIFLDHLELQRHLYFLSNEDIQASYDLWPHRLNLLNRKQRKALYWIEDAAQIPWWEKGAPLRYIFHWWMAHQKIQLIHGAVIGTAKGGVLLGGQGGSGKSTTALACLRSGLLYAGDDYCLLSTDPPVTAYSLYNTAKLKGPGDLERFPELSSQVVNPHRLKDEKVIIFLQEKYSRQIVKSLPIRAVFVPRITHQGQTRLIKTTAQEALKFILPSTVRQLRGSGLGDFHSLRQITKENPCYILEAGTDLAQIPETIADFLSGAA